VIFVVGGVSVLEIQQLQDQLNCVLGDTNESDVPLRVIVGSTAVIGPEDMFYEAFVHMRQNQSAK
jgi:hypothetical protein